MFYIHFFKINRLGMVSDMSEARQVMPIDVGKRSRLGMVSVMPSPTSGSKARMVHVLYLIFLEKSIENGLRYVMSKTSKSCSSTSPTSIRPSSISGQVIFSITHMAHILINNFLKKSTSTTLMSLT